MLLGDDEGVIEIEGAPLETLVGADEGVSLGAIVLKIGGERRSLDGDSLGKELVLGRAVGTIDGTALPEGAALGSSDGLSLIHI